MPGTVLSSLQIVIRLTLITTYEIGAFYDVHFIDGNIEAVGI